MKLDYLLGTSEIRAVLGFQPARGSVLSTSISASKARELSSAIERVSGVRVTSINALQDIAARYAMGSKTGLDVEHYEEQTYAYSQPVHAAAEDVVEAVHDLERKILKLIKSKAREISELCAQSKGQLKTLKTMKDDHSLAGEKGTYLSAIRKALFHEIVGRVVKQVEDGSTAKIENVKASFDPTEAAEQVVARRVARSKEGKAGERSPAVPKLSLWSRNPVTGGWKYAMPNGVTYMIERDPMSERYWLKASPTMYRSPQGFDCIDSSGERAKPGFSPKFKDAESACMAASMHFANVEAMRLDERISSVYAHGTGQSDMTPEAVVAVVNIHRALQSMCPAGAELRLCSTNPACVEYIAQAGGPVAARVIFASERYEVYALPSLVELASFPARGMDLSTVAGEVCRCLSRIKA